MGPMRNRVLIGLLVAGALLAGLVVMLAGGDEAPSAVPTTTTTQPPAPTTTTEPPAPADPWQVEVAYSLVAQLEVHRERPPEPPADYATPTTTPSPASAPGPDGVVQVQVTPDQQAKLATELLLRDDQAALTLIDAEAPPLATSPLVPEGAIGAAAAEAAPGVTPRAAPAPHLPLPMQLTPIPSPGLAWGAEATETGWRITSPTPSGNARVFLVHAREGAWVQLVLPTRPNNQLGWARADHLQLARHSWHLELSISDRMLRVWEGDRLEAETPVVVGKDASPTPLGRFYLNERVRPAEGTIYSPWILSTNAFSDSLERFSGEVPIFALHGGGYDSIVGSAISNGCVRVPPDLLAVLVPKIPIGTPIDIYA